MKTAIYIDGFNLYYGALKGTPYKWLDLLTLFREVLQPHHEIAAINYYTANVSPRPNDPGVAIRQQAYLNALRAHVKEVKVHHGHFLSSTVKMALANPVGNQRFAEVLKTEEKGSDVNLAVHALNDAWSNQYECAVIVSNDSDLSESLRLIKKLQKKIILVTPGDAKVRPPNAQLKRWAMATLSITQEALAASQLPSPIPGTSMSKPGTW
ncbi:NYN domain-containing protein [Lacisediminimonas profundi]|uniref:NYN domain-containing protein n=1 Tax=Lacisediminimonas profundi TaxID=2603856 RepID=UPI00124B5467|nr:NYN domain-containing protein [Lacisediminimonas profundi]